MSAPEEIVKVTLELPKPVADFLSVFAKSNSKTTEEVIKEELIAAVEMHLDIEPTMKNVIIHQFGLQKILE